MSDARMTELEIKVAYQDDLLQVLNDSVGQQQQQIIRLEELVRLLGVRIKSVADSGESINQGLETPPHY